MEVANGARKWLLPLRTGTEVHGYAKSQLANIFLVENAGRQFPIPDWFAQQLLRCEKAPEMLPTIITYAQRPVFDDDFRLCVSGWHPESGILVHGPDIEPYLEDCQLDAELPIDRLPPCLRCLLKGFCFTEPADVANTIGMLLTGLLSNHFVQVQKALCIVDGNQPGTGKTLLVQLIGTILDGQEPNRITFSSNDEELAKQICATLRGRSQSLLLFDNAKTRKGSELSSPTIESNATAPWISFRILGFSLNFERKNDILWFLTMNNTQANQDMISRSCSVRLAFVGKPEERPFELKDPIAFASEHRQQILGELAGLVIRWNQQGRPLGRQQHRQHQWAEIVGGILDANGFPEFLANADDAAACFSSDLDRLAALAELVIMHATVGWPRERRLSFMSTPEMPARDWIRHFDQLQFFEEQNGAISDRAKSVKIGSYLSSRVGREVPFEVSGLGGRATLRIRPGRSRSSLYCFDIRWDTSSANAPAGSPGAAAAPAAETLPTAQTGQHPQQDRPSESGYSERR